MNGTEKRPGTGRHSMQAGSVATLWGTDDRGNTICVDEVADHTGILSYNLSCSLAARVPRIYT